MFHGDFTNVVPTSYGCKIGSCTHLDAKKRPIDFCHLATVANNLTGRFAQNLNLKRMKTSLGGLAVGISLVSAYTADGKTYPQTTVIMTIKSSIDTTFNYIAPINLMHIFWGTGLIPGIVDTSIKEGWNKPGLVRIIHFEDGSTSQESLLTMNSPTSFSYKNDQFTTPMLKFLLKRIEGEWLFTDLGSGQTKIEWTYRAVPKNFMARAILKLVVMKQIRQMLTNALTIAKNDLESGNLDAGRFGATR